MTRRSARWAALAGALLFSAAATAQYGTPYGAQYGAHYAYTNRDVNMRAGPNQEFPLVTWVPGGVQVLVNGCVDGWSWCDITAGSERGWVYADFLSYEYSGQPVTIVSGGAMLGLPLITFSIGPYWDNYYRYRPWYGNRSYWYNRPPTWWYRPAPPPPPRPIVRPPPPRPPHWNAPPPRPPNHGRPPSNRPPEYRPQPQPRPSGSSRPSQGAPEVSRPSSPPHGNAPRQSPPSKSQPQPQQRGGMVLKPDVGTGGGPPYSQQ